MHNSGNRALAILVLALLASGMLRAQTTMKLWPGVAPGSEHWTWKEQTFHVPLNGVPETIVEDVVTPSLQVFLPARARATGTGIIIAPGGACIALVMDSEGTNIARWLQQRGIAAFVLKYRLKHKLVQGMPKDLREDDACRRGVADGAQAVKLVRQHAREWGLTPHQLGMIGFSAGGMIASEVLVQNDAVARPDFVALIYGAPFESMPVVPSKLPPVFMAWAQDDATAGYAMVRFYKALVDAGDAPEAHVYSAGGHGSPPAPRARRATTGAKNSGGGCSRRGLRRNRSRRYENESRVGNRPPTPIRVVQDFHLDGAAMHHSRLCSMQIDCDVEDIDEAARFWAAALGRPVDMDHPGSRENYRQLATPPDEPMVQLQLVKHESRVHLDIETDDIEAEVARLEKHGAVIDKRLERWVVMRAPTGQRFCVVRVQRPGFAENANRWE